MAEAHAELADTQNRHLQLWSDRSSSNSSDMLSFLEVSDRGEMVQAPMQSLLDLKRLLDHHQKLADNYVSSQATVLVAPRRIGSTQVPTFKSGEGASHVISEKLDIQALSLIHDLR
ncbi:hypothetical protein K3495_g14590 [Podosphaera aphanis]|nr:hypothetical protein K3495_g14590 [Podosphaera aphanis]